MNGADSRELHVQSLLPLLLVLVPLVERTFLSRCSVVVVVVGILLALALLLWLTLTTLLLLALLRCVLLLRPAV